MIAKHGALSVEIIAQTTPTVPDRWIIRHAEPQGAGFPDRETDLIQGKSWYGRSDVVKALRRLAADAETLADILEGSSDAP